MGELNLLSRHCIHGYLHREVTKWSDGIVSYRHRVQHMDSTGYIDDAAVLLQAWAD